MSMIEITAERVTETGVLSNGEWINFSKFGPKPQLETGRDYEIEYKEFKGKKYINSVRELQAAAGSASAPAAAPARAARSTAAPGTKSVHIDAVPARTVASAEKTERSDYAAKEDAKSRRILVQGVLQACLHSPGLVGFTTTQDEYLAAVEAATKREVDFINKMVG
jgi:hypothetical protein